MAGQNAGEKAQRRADAALLATYHEARLAELLEHVRRAFTEYDEGRIDAFDLDGVIHQYKRAATELWKFCAVSGSSVGFAVRTLQFWKERGEQPDWWEAGRARRK